MNHILEMLMHGAIDVLDRIEGEVEFRGVTVTSEFIEFVFKNYTESEAVKLANHILDHREKERMEEREYERI